MTLSGAAGQGTDVVAGAIAPPFDLESSKESRVGLADYRGKTQVVLYFMREFT